MNVRPNQSFDVKVEDKVYQHNTHHLMRRYPKKVPNFVSDGDSHSETPKRTLRHWPRVKMPRIPVQAMMQKDFIYI